ncbi:MAG: hypothetical protein ACT4QF_05125 [Sporichthyaceae bacterium]
MTLALTGCGGESALKAAATPPVGTIEDLTEQASDFTIGAITIRESGEDVEVLRVRALTSPNLEYLGAITTWPRDGETSAVGSSLGYPPSRGVHHPAFGTVIPAAETAQILPGESIARPVVVAAGFRLASGTVGLLNVIEVTYRVGDDVKTERSSMAMLACFDPCKAKPKDVDLKAWELQLRDELGVVVRDSKAPAS